MRILYILLSIFWINLLAATTPEQIQQLQKLANEGDAQAQATLGWCYYYGEGVPKNRTLATMWMEKSKEERVAKTERVTPASQTPVATQPVVNSKPQIKNEGSEPNDVLYFILIVVLLGGLLAFMYKYLELRKAIDSITEKAKVEADVIVTAANRYSEAAVLLHQERVTELMKRERKSEATQEAIAQQKESLAELNKVEIAVRNRIEGWNDKYILPIHLLLDELADHVGWSEAGQKLKEARDHSKNLIRQKKAVLSDDPDPTREKSATKLMLEAYDSQVDLALDKIKGEENVGKVIQEIKDIFYSLNDYGRKCTDAEITDEYLASRLDEAKWGAAAYELRKREREEQKAQQAKIREEAQLERDIEKARREVYREEESTRRAMLKAQQESLNLEKELQYEYEKRLKELEQSMKQAVAKDEDEKVAKEAEMKEKMESLLKTHELQSAEQRSKFEAEKLELENKLKDLEGNQRALSMAQQTRSGHVYVISNHGSFGEAVLKVGMTRRLDPMDRVWELGDASVPFDFDVHAMIKCDDAPGLESKLHDAMAAARVNKVNLRKEFFKLSVTDVRKIFDDIGIRAEWTMASKAQEYRETIALESAFDQNPETKKRWMGELVDGP